MNKDLEDLIVETNGPIATITINRPNVRNACRFKTTIELRDVIRRLQSEDSLRAIILTGSGDRAFSAGADLKELKTRDPAQRDRELAEGFGEALRAIESSCVPTIAVVRGFALGGGTEIAMACHLRVAGQSARFGQPEILRGHIPGAGGTVRLPRLVGESKALQYLLTGDEIPAEVAAHLGLVNWVVPDADVVRHDPRAHGYRASAHLVTGQQIDPVHHTQYSGSRISFRSDHSSVGPSGPGSR